MSTKLLVQKKQLKRNPVMKNVFKKLGKNPPTPKKDDFYSTRCLERKKHTPCQSASVVVPWITKKVSISRSDPKMKNDSILSPRFRASSWDNFGITGHFCPQ